MEKTNGYYVAKYLKNNALVLVCELVVVLLLSLICTFIIEAEPVWLTPMIAVVTYLVAELRFMMAYVATNARHEHDLAIAKGEIEADEPSEKTEQADDAAEEPEANEADEVDEAVADDEQAPFVAPVVPSQDEDEQEPEDEYIAEDATEEPVEEPVEEAVEAPVEEAAEEEAPAAKDEFSREIKFQLRQFFGKKKEKEEQPDEVAPVFDAAPTQDTPQADDEDEEMDALFAAPVLTPRAPALTLESIDLEDDEQDDVTMDDDALARDVLEIGEIETSDKQ